MMGFNVQGIRYLLPRATRVWPCVTLKFLEEGRGGGWGGVGNNSEV